MKGFWRTWLGYFHPLNKIHLRIAFERYQPAPVAKPLPEKRQIVDPGIIQLIDKGKKASAAKLGVLGIEKLQAHYGANWERVTEKVHAVIALILKKHMTPDDAFAPVKDNAYILLFGNADEKEAADKCRKIADDIYAVFLRDKKLGGLGLGLSSAISAVDAQTAAKIKNPAELQDMLDQRPVQALEIKDFPVAEPQRTAANREPAFDQNGKPVLPPELEIYFRPLLDVQTRLVTGFSCVPCFGPLSDHEGYDVLAGEHRDNPDLLAQIDQLVLSRARLQLMALEKKKRQSMFICPVHYKTLSDVMRSAVYLQFCAALATDEKKTLIFEIVGIPKSLDAPGVKGAVNTIRPFGKAVMARTQVERQAKSNLAGVGVDILSVDVCPQPGLEGALVPQMKAFMAAAREDKMKAFVTGISSVYLARAAAGAGFNAVGGGAIWSLVKEADPDIRVDTSTFMQAAAG